MKAAVLTSLNSNLEIFDLNIPELSKNQVLVKIKAAGVCGAQLNQKKGIKIKEEFLPCLMGHEGSGIVEKIGPGVEKVKPGDKVVMHWRKSSGVDSEFPKYQSKHGTVGSGLITTFSEFSVVSENRITKVNTDLDFSYLSLFGCAITTGMGVINNEINLSKNDSILIYGVGGVGLNIVIAAFLKQPKNIIAVDQSDVKLNKAKEFGANHLINTKNTPNIRDEIINILGQYPKYNIETTGNIGLIKNSYELLESGGTAVLVGQPKNNENLVFENFVENFNNKTLLDTSGGDINPDIEIQKYIDLYSNKNIKLENLIYDYYNLEEINHVFNLMENSKEFFGRGVIVFE